VSIFTDGALPIAEVFGEAGTQLEEKLLDATSEPERVAPLDRFFLERLPKLDESLATVSRIVDRIQNEGNLTQVEDLVKATGLGTRALQRLFDKHVGVSPKWFIRTVRFQTAVKAVGGGERFDWADFALRLGYYDQSHFINDFRSIVGESPDALTGRLQTDFSL
jgi:AraC-like DNA-binding protein